MKYLIEGPLESDYSLALVNRLLAYALIEKQIDVLLHQRDNTTDYNPSANFLTEHPRLAARLAPDLASHWTDVHTRYIYPPHSDRMCGERNGVHCYGWEETVFPERYAAWMNDGLDFITTMSQFTSDVLTRAQVKTPVFNVGIGVDHITALPAEPVLDLQTPGTFDFLHVSSCFPRKGADVLIEAFCSTFDETSGVRLVVKTFPNPHNEIHSLLAGARRKYPRHAPVIVMEEPLTAPQMRWLYENTACLVAPSRGEGFGLPAAEAMLLGRPVIATAYSGHSEFCDNDTCWPVDFDLTPARSHVSESSSLWAEPKIDSLRDQMMAVRGASPQELSARIEPARRRIRDRFTWAHVAERQLSVIASLGTTVRGQIVTLGPEPAVEQANPQAHARSQAAAYTTGIHLRTFSAEESNGATLPRESPLGGYSIPLRVERSSRPCIGIVTSWNSKCGIAEYSRYTTSAFADAGLDYLVFANDTEGLVRQDEGYVRRSWVQGVSVPAGFRRLIEDIRASGVDVVSLQYNYGFFPASVLDYLTTRLQQAGIAVIITMHALARAKFSSYRECLSRADLVVVHQEQDAAFLRSQGVTRVGFLPHGNPVPRTPPERVDDEWFTISSFGFLLPFKGIYELLCAFACALQVQPRMRLSLSTALYPIHISSIYANACRKLIERFHLNSRVSLDTRFLDDEAVLDRLCRSDLVVLPYTYSTESASGAIRLPLASMRPVLSSDLAVFKDSFDVLHLYPAGNTVALARRILELCADPELRRSKESAQRAYTERLAWPRISAAFAQYCLETAGSRTTVSVS